MTTLFYSIKDSVQINFQFLAIAMKIIIAILHARNVFHAAPFSFYIDSRYLFKNISGTYLKYKNEKYISKKTTTNKNNNYQN